MNKPKNPVMFPDDDDIFCAPLREACYQEASREFSTKALQRVAINAGPKKNKPIRRSNL